VRPRESIRSPEFVLQQDQELPMTTTADYETVMRRALELAARGPVTGGNPQVGCVLLTGDGIVVAEGWHHGAGTPHAEIDALSGVESARGLTAVVTLEPCNHTGRTGPCSEALITAGVGRVVYAVDDPCTVSGGGSDRLRAAGIQVVSGVLADEASEFLHPWLTSAELGRPYVQLKWASSLDGRAAAPDGSSQWITGTASRQRVHEQRAAVDAIVVGTGTVLADNPSLTARGDGGELLSHQPIPVVIGSRAVPEQSLLRSHPAGLIEAGAGDLAEILTNLFDRGIRRVFVEGGPTLASSFIAADLVDEYLIYLGPVLLGGDRVAIRDLGITNIRDARALTITSVESLGSDILVAARPAARQER
jgi:diaminohydroxyphosphoribosylaminopyrimidine deaminase/5-amino-6-(5-phosphoribosylamino)uracil reductase